jgi:hypothetical protein
MFYNQLVKTSNANIFSEKFIEVVQRRRDTIDSRNFKLLGFQIPIFALLMMALIPIQAKVSVAGITPEASRNLREVLVVVSALLGLAVTFSNIHENILKDMVKAYIQKISKRNSAVSEFLEVGYDVSSVVFPDRYLGDHVQLGWGVTVFFGAWISGLCILLAAVLLGAFCIHVAILRDIYVDPSFSAAVSASVIGFVLLCDFVGLSGSIFASGLVAVRSYENMMKLSKWYEKKPDEANKVYREIARTYSRRPFIGRILSRPSMPNRLPD